MREKQIQQHNTFKQMASFNQENVSYSRSGRTIHAPRRFCDETFTKGSGVKGCDHYDHGYDQKDITGKQNFVSIEWRWNADVGIYEEHEVDDRPDQHLEDLEDFIVQDGAAEEEKAMKCYGCMHNLAGQEAHMGPNGCLGDIFVSYEEEDFEDYSEEDDEDSEYYSEEDDDDEDYNEDEE